MGCLHRHKMIWRWDSTINKKFIHASYVLSVYPFVVHCVLTSTYYLGSGVEFSALALSESSKNFRFWSMLNMGLSDCGCSDWGKVFAIAKI